ncbi:MAG: UDP-N-acetylmuramate dehydrogenase [Clostridia bacterium]|nr:UDP-N-acetylmuramate dehydrogenase [Clostridia bacterium]
MREDLLQALWNSGIALSQNEPLARHSSFRIGGNAKIAVFPKNREELICALESLKDENPLVIGKGSNLVFPDEGLARPLIFTEGLQALAVSENQIAADAGTPLISLCRAAEEVSLSGLEFAFGIPGSVGGGIYMNAGAFGGELGSFCRSVTYYDGIGVKTIAGADCSFSYRHSLFCDRKNFVILSAEFSLAKGKKEEISALMKEILAKRKEKQPLEYPSAGSVFKRPQGFYAAKLIEDSGLKGLRVGGAEVSEKHAGFIVNRGGATASDVKELIKIIRETVFAKTGVSLECEIEFL